MQYATPQVTLQLGDWSLANLVQLETDNPRLDKNPYAIALPFEIFFDSST
jgi:hypothetical protein